MQSMFKPTQGLMIPFCIPNWILTQELLTQSAETGGRRNTKLSTRRGTRDPQQGARGSGRMARRCSVSARHGQRAPSSSVTAAVSSRAVTAPARRWWAEWRRIAWASAATSAWGHRLRPAGTRICTPGALITDQQTQRTAGWCWKEQYPKNSAHGELRLYPTGIWSPQKGITSLFMWNNSTFA